MVNATDRNAPNIGDVDYGGGAARGGEHGRGTGEQHARFNGADCLVVIVFPDGRKQRFGTAGSHTLRMNQ